MEAWRQSQKTKKSQKNRRRRKKALEVGADYYLLKPYDKEEILSLVKKALFPLSEPRPSQRSEGEPKKE